MENPISMQFDYQKQYIKHPAFDAIYKLYNTETMKNYCKKIVSLFILPMISLHITHLTAQVTIGADKSPADYSVLQIENTTLNGAGVRLPNVAEIDKKNILNPMVDRDKSAAKGLTIYNNTTDKVEYWDGAEWVGIPVILPSISATNGIATSKATNPTTKTDTYTMGLNNNISENTIITLNNKLTFTQNANTSFKINSTKNTFVVKNNNVGIGTDNPTTKLHIAKPTTGNGFHLNDGNQGVDKILTTDNHGNASWKPMLSHVTVDSKNVETSSDISSDTNIAIASGTPPVKYITCTSGKWLIIAKCSSKKDGDTPSYYTWLKLKDENGKILAVAGVTAEKNKNYNFSTPLIVYYGEFATDTKVSLYAEGQSGTTLQNFRDNGFFKAIKISK